MTHTPRLEKVTGTAFSVKCRHCGALVGAGNGFDTVADLDGEPWTAYFHAECAARAGEYDNHCGDHIGFRPHSFYHGDAS